MKNFLRFSILASGLAIAAVAAAQQSKDSVKPQPAQIDLGLSYTLKVGKIAGVSSSSFVMNGGAADITWWKPAGRVGVAAELSGESGTPASGVGLNQISLVAGPRYRLWRRNTGRRAELFGEGLAGFVHASNGVFPSGAGVKSSETAFALQAGGGFNLPLNARFALRLPQVDYIYSRLHNNTDKFQGNFRVSGGVTVHF